MKSIVGKILCDRYRIIRQLHQHDWKTTYLGEDLANNSKARCIIDQLQPQYGREVLAGQFWQKTLQTFIVRGNLLQKASHHPQIPQLLDFFECDRQFYLVKELVDGVTLEQKLDNLLLDETEAIAWLREMLTILEFTHKLGVAHLNIQPANLVQLEEGSKYLTNFAAIESAVLFDRQEVSSLLNPDFSPHGERGSSGMHQSELDRSSDIYALGKTIIFALTGELTNSIQSKSLDEVRSQQLTNLNNSPSAKIRPELARILNKMVANQREQSYQSATEVLNELDFSKNVVVFPPPFISSPIRDRPTTIDKNKKAQTATSLPKFVIRPIWFLLSLPFIVAAVIIFVGLNKNSQPNFVEYTNSDYQFSLKYPQDWSQQQVDDPITGEIVVFNSPQETETDSFLEKVHVAIEYLSSESTSLEEYSQTVLNRISETQGSDVVLNRDFPSTIDNAPARTVIYSLQQGSLQLTQMESFTIKNDRVYIAIYTAERAKFSEFYPTVEKMVDSWEIQ